MAHYAHALTHSFTANIVDGITALKEAAAERYAHFRVYHSSIAELRKLSDRDLNDIGMNRSMIKSVALEAADKRAKR